MQSPFPFRSDAEQSAFERIPFTPFAVEDRPYLNIARVCVAGHYEIRDIAAKRLLDLSGAAENLWWYNWNKTRETNVF
jgi:hypothetical protein